MLGFSHLCLGQVEVAGPHRAGPQLLLEPGDVAYAEVGITHLHTGHLQVPLSQFSCRYDSKSKHCGGRETQTDESRALRNLLNASATASGTLMKTSHQGGRQVMERPRVERGDDLADFLLCLQFSGHVESLHTCAQPSYHPCAPEDPWPLRSLPGSPAATSHRSCPMTAPLPGPAQAWRTHPIQFISASDK